MDITIKINNIVYKLTHYIYIDNLLVIIYIPIRNDRSLIEVGRFETHVGKHMV